MQTQKNLSTCSIFTLLGWNVEQTMFHQDGGCWAKLPILSLDSTICCFPDLPTNLTNMWTQIELYDNNDDDEDDCDDDDDDDEYRCISAAKQPS